MVTILNNSLRANSFNNHQHLKLLIDVCTLLNSIFAIIISLLIIRYIGRNFLRKNKLKKSINVSLLLTCNTCLAIICASSTLILMMLSSIGGDLNISTLKQITSWACHIRGYIHFAFISTIYLSYVLQAGYRLFRIAFYESKCPLKIYSMLVCIVIQWIFSFVLMLPILMAHKDYSSFIVYLPQQFYCQVPMTNIRGIIFSILSVYFVPLCCIGMIYLWIIIYIRRRNRHCALMILLVQHKNKRDTIIIKRICLIMILLLLLGIPTCLFSLSFMITGSLHWASYRICWMTISISFTLISLSSIYVTPQIYKPICIMFNHSNSKQNKKYLNISFSTNNNFEIQRKIDNPFVKQNLTISTV